MKKIITFTLLAVLLMPSAMASAAPTASTQEALTGMAFNLVEQMSSLCGSSSYYQMMFTGRDDIQALFESWGGDWAKRENCRRAAVVFAPQDTLDALFPELLTSMNMDGLADCGDVILPRFAGSVGSILNGANGVTWLAAASAATISDICVTEGIQPGIAYVLLDYFGPDHPLALVTFVIKADGATSMNAVFVKADDKTETVFDAADDAVDLHRLASDALAAQEPALAKAILAALDEITVTALY